MRETEREQSVPVAASKGEANEPAISRIGSPRAIHDTVRAVARDKEIFRKFSRNFPTHRPIRTRHDTPVVRTDVYRVCVCRVKFKLQKLENLK